MGGIFVWMGGIYIIIGKYHIRHIILGMSGRSFETFT